LLHTDIFQPKSRQIQHPEGMPQIQAKFCCACQKPGSYHAAARDLERLREDMTQLKLLQTAANS
jgi:hypothetical protein